MLERRGEVEMKVRMEGRDFGDVFVVLFKLYYSHYASSESECEVSKLPDCADTEIYVWMLPISNVTELKLFSSLFP